MSRKDVIQNELDYLNAVMSGGIVGGLIVSIIQYQVDKNLVDIWSGIVVFAFVGGYVRYQRKKYLKELNDIE